MESEKERAVAFGKVLREERERVRVTQGELAQMVGYNDKSTISKMETGKAARPPTRAKIEQIAEALDVPPGRLLRSAGYESGGPILGGEDLEEIEETVRRAQRLLDELAERLGLE